MSLTAIPSFQVFTYPNGKEKQQFSFKLTGLVAFNPGSTAAAIPITAWSITSNVVTFTADNSLSSGNVVVLSGFGTSTFFNGVQVTVLSSGLSGTAFEADFTHANGSATEAGQANLAPEYVTGGVPTTWFPMITGEGGEFIPGTLAAQPLWGSVDIFSIAGTGYIYQWDYAPSTIRIVSSGTELSNGAVIVTDTVVFRAQFEAS